MQRNKRPDAMDLKRERIGIAEKLVDEEAEDLHDDN